MDGKRIRDYCCEARRSYGSGKLASTRGKSLADVTQPFSTSRIVKINIVLGPELPDVKRNGYCFTDGVGVAGLAVLIEAAIALGVLKGLNATPSAIQFRLG